jgi:NAD(P)H-dependent FMN reductase
VINILAFAGSTRTGSFNKKLVKIAAQGAEKAGAIVTVIDLLDFPMPLFSEDIESETGIPEAARNLKKLMIASQGFLIASPEYNSAFSPVLKNAIDWVSRVEKEDEPPLQAFKGKFAALMAASPGPLGGIRGLVMVRMLLANIGVTVLPDQQTIRNAYKAFNDEGSLIDDKKQDLILNLGKELAVTLFKMTA